jgi:GDP-L-fucose synthase
MIRAAEKITDGSPVNAGTAEHIKIIDCAKAIFEEVGWSPKEFHFDRTKPVGVYSRAADLTRSRSLLGWEPEIGFREGLRRTIEWYYATHDQAHVGQNMQVLLNER